MRTIINIILFSSLMFISSTVLALDYDNILQKTIILIFGDQAALDNHHQEKLAQAILDGEGLFDSLTELQKVIVHSYTINPELFNEGLKNGFDIDSGENEVFYAKALRDALQELDSNSYLSYRGGVYPSGVYSGKFKIGDIIYNNTFTSTSLSGSVAKKFSGLQNPKDGYDNIIHIFESNNATNITSFSSTFKSEAEILLHPETVYEIKKIEKINGVFFVVSSEIDEFPPNATVRDIYTGNQLTFDCN